MSDEKALKGELKDIYHRVMNTSPQRKDPKNAPTQQLQQQSTSPQPPVRPVTVSPQDKATQQPPAQQAAEQKSEQGEKNTPPPQDTSGPVATSFAYSSKNPLKPKKPEKPKLPQKKEQNTTQTATQVAKSSNMPIILGGMGVFAVIWGAVWALLFGLI